jgi:hypothetical protein
MKCGKILRIAVVILLACGLAGMIGTPALAAPLLEPSPESGAVGTRVTVSGENWDSFSGDEIYIFFDNEEITPILVPQAGRFQFDFDIPDDAEPGEHIIRARSELGSTLSTSTFTVLEAEISLSAESGVVGSKLVIDGEGFYANKVVSIYFDNKILGTLPASSTGEFSYSFNVPDSIAGEHDIIAANAEDNVYEAEFEVLPLIVINPTTGAIGSIIQVDGNGFASKSDISVFFQYDEVAYAKTDEDGTFEASSFNVPQAPTGTYDVTVEDEEGNTAKYEFSITAGAGIDTDVASVGSELTVTGSGFEASGEIGIEFDGMAVATIVADNNGSFQFVFKVPMTQHGEHIISVSDGTDIKELVFEIESEAPPVPAPLLPGDGSTTRAATYFDWEDVDDPSLPVRYQLQIASDGDFAFLVMEITLAESEYTMGDETAVAAVTKDAPYYWRVKAVDGAANESDWSAPRSFLVLAPPAPALLAPEKDGEAEAEAYFDWEDVTSLSPPVTYQLQVASGKGFAEVVLEKGGLTESEYNATEEEKLPAVKKDAPYYWRVRAIDDIGNEGEWSAPDSFTVGFYLALPNWALYTLIAFGAIVIGFLAFWLGRRTAYGE